MTQVGEQTVTKIRRLYREVWGCEWPHDDGYVRELWLETRNEVSKGCHKVPPTDVWERCLEAMRENHSIPRTDDESIDVPIVLPFCNAWNTMTAEEARAATPEASCWDVKS